jgi:hypothetical protein
MIIRAQRIDEQKRVTAAAEIIKSSSLTGSRYRKSSNRNDRRRSSARTGDIEIIQRNVRREPTHIFDDLNESRTISQPVNEDDTSSL